MGNHRVTQVADGIRDNDAVNVKQLNDALTNVDTTPSQEFITNVNNQFEQEAAARKTADDAEAQARQAGDTTLQANIDDEAAKRIAGDAAEAAARTTAVNNEAQARIAGDAAEAQARSNADIALGQRIDTQTAIRVAEVSRLDGRIDQASRRLDDIEKNAYRCVAIALAAQQAVPNIRPGQIAVFAGGGHYEGETAGSVGIATSFISNRISLSGAGGNEVGSRIGLTYLW
uniref:YadA-like family protein n=1 Tax=Acinetobacter ursingii TaxID=108980 RepID=UPI003709550C